MTTFAGDYVRNDTAALSAISRERNNVLSALSAETLALIEPAFGQATLSYGTVLWEPGSPGENVYFRCRASFRC